MKSTLGIVLALLTLLELTFSSQVAFAANDITRLVPFQGRLHGGDNKIVSDGTYDLTFYIYETPTGGTSLWTETHPSVSVIHGYVNVLLGAISPMVESNYANQAPLYGEDKNTVNFAQKKYLGISINGGAEMFPRSQLVPTFHAYTANHATHATQADNADSLGDKAASTYAQLSYVNSQIDLVTGNVGDKFTGNVANNANDANKLDGHDSTYFAVASNSNSRLSSLEGKFTGTKAKDADKLDNLDSTNFMRNTTANGYPGLTPGGSTTNWVRTTTNGLLPYQQGGASSIGTSSWNFTNIYGVNIYDGNTLLENKYLGKTATSANASKLNGQSSSYYATKSSLTALSTRATWQAIWQGTQATTIYHSGGTGLFVVTIKTDGNYYTSIVNVLDSSNKFWGSYGKSSAFYVQGNKWSASSGVFHKISKLPAGNGF
jgi:hypothetical protein